MKKTIIAFFVSAFLLISCSSDDSSSNPSTGEVLLRSLIITYDDGTSFTSNYTYNGNRLTGYSDTDGLDEVYIYSGGLLTQIDEFEDGILDIETLLEYDDNDRLIKETYMYEDGTSQINEFVYNADGTITEIEDDMTTYIYAYVNGNRSTETDVDGNYDYTYTYDDKNNPFKNVHQREVLDLIGEYASLNNILTYMNTGGGPTDDDFTSTYTYNSDDFPITATSTFLEAGTNTPVVETLQFIYE